MKTAKRKFINNTIQNITVISKYYEIEGTTGCKQWRSQEGETGANAPDLVDSAPAPAPGPELLFAPGPARVPSCFSPRVNIGLNCHPNLFVEFTNLLIVFPNSFISFELQPRKFNSSKKATIKNLFLDVLYYQLIAIYHRRRKWARWPLWPPAQSLQGPLRSRDAFRCEFIKGFMCISACGRVAGWIRRLCN